jgi:hypothetical protein
VTGKDVYLVLSPPRGRPGTVRIAVDGSEQPPIHVTTQRLYHLASRPRAQALQLTLRPSRGVAAYAFTFG